MKGIAKYLAYTAPGVAYIGYAFCSGMPVIVTTLDVLSGYILLGTVMLVSSSAKVDDEHDKTSVVYDRKSRVANCSR
jgi:hypothetical protein